MKKDIDSVPVYTRDSLGLRGETDDKKRQGKIDEWTDRLATRMAATTSSYIEYEYSPHSATIFSRLSAFTN